MQLSSRTNQRSRFSLTDCFSPSPAPLSSSPDLLLLLRLCHGGGGGVSVGRVIQPGSRPPPLPPPPSLQSCCTHEHNIVTETHKLILTIKSNSLCEKQEERWDLFFCFLFSLLSSEQCSCSNLILKAWITAAWWNFDVGDASVRRGAGAAHLRPFQRGPRLPVQNRPQPLSWQ